MILNSAMSLDGKIATRSGRARISSPEDLARVQNLRSSVDGIMVGINTLLADDPSLRVKIPIQGGPPARIVVDSSLRTPPLARLFSFPGKIIIGTSQKADPKRLAEISERAEVIVVGTHRVNLRQFMEELAARGLKRILLEGGGTLNWEMLRSGLVDEIRIAIAPLVIGGRDTITLVEGKGVSNLGDALEMELVDVSRCGKDIVLGFKSKVRQDDDETG